MNKPSPSVARRRKREAKARVASALQTLDMEPRDLAYRLGVDPATVANWIKGRHGMSRVAETALEGLLARNGTA